MCWEDYHMTENANAVEVPYTVGASSGVFIPANKDRISLVISCPSSGRITISLNPTAVLDSGITLNSGGLPLVLDSWLTKGLVKQAFYAIGSAGGLTGAIWQGFLDNPNKKKG